VTYRYHPNHRTGVIYQYHPNHQILPLSPCRINTKSKHNYPINPVRREGKTEKRKEKKL